MISPKRHYTILASLALIAIMIASGCTSSGEKAGTSPAQADDGGYHSSFAELAGTYVSAADSSSSIILYPDGAARIQAGTSGVDTSIYMEMGVLKLADGTEIGSYPIENGTLIYQGVKYLKQS